MDRALKFLVLLVTLYLSLNSVDCQVHKWGDDTRHPPNPILASKFRRDESLILVSTLDGNLIAVCKKTGSIKWKLEDAPVLNLSRELSESFNLLPDPKDGSLYMLSNTASEAITKLPFTIPELVAASPSQSSDGMLYMGKKLDTWFVIDPKTGKKQEILSFNGQGKACPRNKFSGPSIFLGRTEYSLALLDGQTTERRWSVTYFDYTSVTSGLQDTREYDLAHFTSSSTGQLLTLDRLTGDLVWQQDFLSPVVGMYGLIHDISNPVNSIGLSSISFSSLSAETLLNLARRIVESPKQDHQIAGDIKLYPTLFVGQSRHGVYAIPSLADQYTPTVTSLTGPLLIDGPPLKEPGSVKSNPSWKPFSVEQALNVHFRLPFGSKGERLDHPRNSRNSILLMGEPKISEYPSNWISPSAANEDKTDEKATGWNLIHLAVASLVAILVTAMLIPKILPKLNDTWTLFGMVDIASVGRSSYAVRSQEMNSASPIELPSGCIQVGKILFDPSVVLGKGCEGTFVYKGKYDTRDVAVKRLLPECFTVADREVMLLRESDAHPNVIRYFCTEQDRQFKYITLELCAATLQDFVEGKYQGPPIEAISIMRHATAGISHLHSLDIVHRDIKPHNVLISVPNAKGEVRAMISDFGLCKKLKIGRMSFSRRSGLAGTDGWIAPEMMEGEDTNMRTTCAVDIFSLGLVYFYLLSKGRHPFGDKLRRQANILSGEYDISELSANVTSHCLIEKMLSIDPLERPPARAILKHPIFWQTEKVLAFFQDVSDRVEKDSSDSVVLQSLERSAYDVVRGNWKLHIDEIVMKDLQRHRNYQSRSVRDLLRALRNKKNHYREVTAEVRRIMGENPHEFCYFWISRFPKLLMHSWYAMHCVKNEHIFSRYYDKQYDFLQKYNLWATRGQRNDSIRNRKKTEIVTELKAPQTVENGSRDPPEETQQVPDCWEQLESKDEETVQPISTELQNREEENEDVDNQIVLGPGGHWGFEKMDPKRQVVVDPSTTKVASWSLPSAGQQSWNYSEIAHHGRKKQKLNHKKKKKEEM